MVDARAVEQEAQHVVLALAVGDPWEPESRVREQEQALRQAGADVEFHRYAAAKHWFAERDRPEYHAPSAEEAWERTTRFLAARLGPAGA